MKRALSFAVIIIFLALSFGSMIYAANNLRSSGDGETRAHIEFTTGGQGQPAATDPHTEAPGSAPVTEPSTEAPVTGTEPAVQPPEASYADNLENVLSPATVEGMIYDRTELSVSEREELYRRLAASTVFDGETMEISASGTWDGDHRIVLLSEGLYFDYTCGTEKVMSYYREPHTDDASFETHSIEITRFRAKVQPYMGYLIITFDELDDKTGEPVVRYALHAPDGSELIHDLEGKTPHYSRDFSNDPVFIDQKGALFAFDGKEFKKTSYGKLRSELYYDYPATPIAAYNGQAEVSVLDSTGACRFVNVVSGKNYISTKYKRAFNFSENGLAVVSYAKTGEVKIINTAAKMAVGSTVWKIYPGTKTYVVYVYMLHDTLGIESIGCSRFDHGWIRVREQALSRMRNNRDKIFQDKDVLINAAGERFEVPEGYTIEGYSDGVILLKSRDGFYGYYSIEGKWIARPIYTYARPFIQGLAVLGFEDGTVGMIDREGNIVMPFIYTCLSDVSSGVITAYVEGIGWNTYLMTQEAGERE